MNKYNIHKAIQMACYFIKKSNGPIKYLKLIKLMYLADRESFKTKSCSITNDRYFSMEYGMVGETTYDEIKCPSDVWREHIKITVYDAEIIKDQEPPHLTTQEKGLLDGVWERFGHLGPFVLAEHTHKLGEYKEVNGDSQEVFPADILNAIVSEMPPPSEEHRMECARALKEECA